jgi:hypothetical protein
VVDNQLIEAQPTPEDSPSRRASPSRYRVIWRAVGGQAVLLALVLVGSLAGAGCSGSGPPTNPAATAARDFFNNKKYKLPPAPAAPKEPPSPPAKQP